MNLSGHDADGHDRALNRQRQSGTVVNITARGNAIEHVNQIITGEFLENQTRTPFYAPGTVFPSQRHLVISLYISDQNSMYGYAVRDRRAPLIFFPFRNCETNARDSRLVRDVVVTFDELLLAYVTLRRGR